MTLTKRQHALLWGLSAGMSMAEIASMLHMSPSTVAGHRRKLGMELGLSDGNVVLLLRASVAAGHLPKDVLARSVDSLLKKVVLS